MVAQGEGAKVSGETAQSNPTTCGNYLLFCSHVGKLLYRFDPPKLLPKRMPVFSEIGGAFYPSTDTLPALLSGLRLLYWSQTTSTILACCSWAWTWGGGGISSLHNHQKSWWHVVWESWKPELQRGLWHQLLGLHLWLQHSCSLGSPRGLPWFPIWGCQAELKDGGLAWFPVGKSHLGCHLLTDRRCITAKMGSSHSSKMKLKGLFCIFSFRRSTDSLFFFMGSAMGVAPPIDQSWNSDTVVLSLT